MRLGLGGIIMFLLLLPASMTMHLRVLRLIGLLFP
jgi:hypothetical protein